MTFHELTGWAKTKRHGTVHVIAKRGRNGAPHRVTVSNGGVSMAWEVRSGRDGMQFTTGLMSRAVAWFVRDIDEGRE